MTPSNILKSEFPNNIAQVGSVTLNDRGQVLKDIELKRINVKTAREIVETAFYLKMMNKLNYEIWIETLERSER